MSMPVVSIVGRVNVGKSTLFNRIVGGRAAIVDQSPGVTRDRNIAVASWGGKSFYVVDTGGLAPGSEDPMQASIERQIGMAVAESDVLVLVVDAQVGIHPADSAVADLVRRSGLPVLLVANKIDNPGQFALAAEFFGLGIGKPWPVSAAHGTGSGDLLDALVALLPEAPEPEGDELRLAVVGRPNVGKSSLVNRLCGEERNIVDARPGTTRDSTDTVVEHGGRKVRIIDTAGLRRRNRDMEDVEYYSVLRTWKSLDRGDVVIVMLDGQEGLTHQDLRIIGRAWEGGKGVLIVVNKLDLGLARKQWLDDVLERFPAARWIPVSFVSALEGTGVGRLLPMVIRIGDRRGASIQTAELNKVLRIAVAKAQPPSPGGKPLRLFYATQVAKSPPRIAIFVNRPDLVPENYRRYLENSLHEALSLKGVPLRISYRKREH
ncbi:ribosome biogenesis GTPase Der [Candidatus Fermentibacterales bacterium]|nr:ribosome biogenesis GTPase Der [Candidatus Fermentibacterales bacterium]